MNIDLQFNKLTLQYQELLLIDLLRKFFIKNNIDYKKGPEFSTLTDEALIIRYLYEYLLRNYYTSEHFWRLHNKTSTYYNFKSILTQSLKSFNKNKELTNLITKIVTTHHSKNIPLAYMLPYSYSNINYKGIILKDSTYHDEMTLTINPFSFFPEISSDYCNVYKPEDVETILIRLYGHKYWAKLI